MFLKWITLGGMKTAGKKKKTPLMKDTTDGDLAFLWLYQSQFDRELNNLNIVFFYPCFLVD